MLRTTLSGAFLAAFVAAQNPDVPAVPDAPDAAAEAAPALPAANSEEARGLVSQALDKAQAFGRGVFRCTTHEDAAMLREAGIPLVGGETTLDGGWMGNLIWGDFDGRKYVAANGRMFAEVDGSWRLRRRRLADGVELPFAFDPDQLFYVLDKMPKRSTKVVNVQPGKFEGREVAMLTWHLDAEDALELHDSGVVPAAKNGVGGMIFQFGGLGGAVQQPRPELDTYVAFTVDPDNGDLLRVEVKTYHRDTGGNVQMAVQIFAAGGDAEEEEEEEPAEKGPVTWRRGLPEIDPEKDQSVLTFRVDFHDLGLAKPPQLDPEVETALRVR